MSVASTAEIREAVMGSGAGEPDEPALPACPAQPHTGGEHGYPHLLFPGPILRLWTTFQANFHWTGSALKAPNIK